MDASKKERRERSASGQFRHADSVGWEPAAMTGRSQAPRGKLSALRKQTRGARLTETGTDDSGREGEGEKK